MPNQVNIKDASGATVSVDTQGTAITGQTLESGGYGPMGWLSSIRNAITTNFTSLLARFPNSLISGRLDVNLGASGITLPVSLASVPLPTGAATAAKQPTLGTPGSPSTDVITVQGVASGTAQPVSGTVTANLGTLNGAATDATLTARLPAAFGSGGGIKVDIVSGAGSGGTAANDNAAFTAGTTATTPAAGFYHATRDNLTDGRSGAVALTQKRAQLVQLETSGGVEISPALDATLTGGTQKAILRGAAKGSTTAADVTIDPVDANTNALHVTLARPLDSTNDEVRTVSCLPANILKGYTQSDMTTTANTSVIAAPGAGVRVYVTDLLVTNSHATQGTFVNILDGSTVIWGGYAAAVGGGWSHEFRTPLQLTVNTALQAACVTTGAAVRVSATGFKGA